MPTDTEFDEADLVRDQQLAADRAERATWTRWAQRAATLLLVALVLLALGRLAVELAPVLLQVLP